MRQQIQDEREDPFAGREPTAGRIPGDRLVNHRHEADPVGDRAQKGPCADDDPGPWHLFHADRLRRPRLSILCVTIPTISLHKRLTYQILCAEDRIEAWRAS